MPVRQFGMLVQHHRRQFPRPGQQGGIGLQVGKAQQRRAGLTRPQKLARPTSGRASLRA